MWLRWPARRNELLLVCTVSVSVLGCGSTVEPIVADSPAATSEVSDIKSQIADVIQSEDGERARAMVTLLSESMDKITASNPGKESAIASLGKLIKRLDESDEDQAVGVLKEIQSRLGELQ
jgi:hypothetical protein